jgi:hypothetical protein
MRLASRTDLAAYRAVRASDHAFDACAQHRLSRESGDPPAIAVNIIIRRAHGLYAGQAGAWDAKLISLNNLSFTRNTSRSCPVETSTLAVGTLGKEVADRLASATLTPKIRHSGGAECASQAAPPTAADKRTADRGVASSLPSIKVCGDLGGAYAGSPCARRRGLGWAGSQLVRQQRIDGGRRAGTRTAHASHFDSSVAGSA